MVAALDLPAYVGTELVKRQTRLFKNPWQYECAVAQADSGAASILVQTDFGLCAVYTKALGLEELVIGQR